MPTREKPPTADSPPPPLLARAYLVLDRLGSPDAQNAAGGLVQACGSVEVANAYLDQLAAEMDAGEE